MKVVEVGSSVLYIGYIMLGRGMEIFIWGIERKIYKGKGMHGAELVKASCLTISITAYRYAQLKFASFIYLQNIEIVGDRLYEKEGL